MVLRTSAFTLWQMLRKTLRTVWRLYPENCCQHWSGRNDAQVNLLEIELFAEANLEEIPVTVLSCDHFVTAKILNGHMGMTEVFTHDMQGCAGLRDVPAVLAESSMPGLSVSCETILQQSIQPPS